jgi:hypothetical protein
LAFSPFKSANRYVGKPSTRFPAILPFPSGCSTGSACCSALTPRKDAAPPITTAPATASRAREDDSNIDRPREGLNSLEANLISFQLSERALSSAKIFDGRDGLTENWLKLCLQKKNFKIEKKVRGPGISSD